MASEFSGKEVSGSGDSSIARNLLCVLPTKVGGGFYSHVALRAPGFWTTEDTQRSGRPLSLLLLVPVAALFSST